MASEYIEVHSTTSSQAEADRICSAVVDARLAAGAQVVGPVQSNYWWQGKVQQAEEYFLILETTRDRFVELARVIRANHSYEVPRIMAVPIVEGTDDYLAWISSETRASGAPA